MPDYKAMYCKLCHAQAKLDYLFEEARAVISEVQRETERLYVESNDPIVLSSVEKIEPDEAAPTGTQNS